MAVYQELIDLKYRKGVPTFKLMKHFPKRHRQIHEVALMGVSEKVLQKAVKEKKFLKKILALKKKYPLPRKNPKRKDSWLSGLFRTFTA